MHYAGAALADATRTSQIAACFMTCPVAAAICGFVVQLGENIQVLLLPIKGLSAELTRLKEQNKWAIDSRLLAFALGLDFAADSGETSAPAAAN